MKTQILDRENVVAPGFFKLRFDSFLQKTFHKMLPRLGYLSLLAVLAWGWSRRGSYGFRADVGTGYWLVFG